MKPVYRLKFDHPDMHGLVLDVTGSTAQEAMKAFAGLAVEVGNYAGQFAKMMPSTATPEDVDLPVEPLPDKD